MKLPALYVLSGEYLQAAERMAELDLPEEVIADTLEGLRGDLETKSTNVAMMVRNLEAASDAIKVAEANMANRRQAIEKRAARIREYLKSNMEKAGITKIECPLFALTIKKNPASVEIVDVALVPDEYRRIPPIPLPEPDKKAIKAALDEGKDVPGAKMKQTTRLEIK